MTDHGHEHFDVIVVGAGLSGIGQAYHLQTRCPDRSYAILEAREALGGTWDLFRYPGIRSDSDMHTLGFSFRPWTAAKAIADGETIRAYLDETARAHGINRRIRYGMRVTAAAWSSEEAHWTVTASGPAGAVVTMTCGFLCLCSGYYDYARGHAPVFPCAGSFAGRIVHPQFWPADYDDAGKRVVVIGSGATAMTLVPALAGTAAHVTMLQRSPTYVVARPGEDALANGLRRWLPGKVAHGLTRWKNVLLGQFFYGYARGYPVRVKKRLLAMMRGHLGPDYDIATHFTPRYDPWDQRLCLVPDGDLFDALKSGRADVVTDTIGRFTPGGIRLASGRELEADIIVTATGLELKLAGGVAFTVDGAVVDLAKALQYKGMMFSDVPNLAYTFGYTNASWTLKAELVAAYVCRLLNTMRKRGLRQATPFNDDAAMAVEPAVDLTSGYIRRAAATLPKQGTRRPWRLHQNYARDLIALRFGSVDKAMRFSNPSSAIQAKRSALRIAGSARQQ
jgi:cation diffusion facilitator CzcD-associated flavoprotein CzcO